MLVSNSLQAKNSSAFDDFLTVFRRTNLLESADINNITATLMQKFNCPDYRPLGDCRSVSTDFFKQF